MSWLTTATGAGLVVVVLRDVFMTLWYPAGHGSLSWNLSRSLWRLGRSHPWALRRAGPATLVAVILMWGSLAALGWALIYFPHMDESFHFASGLDPGARSDLLDAVYISLVTLVTLGYGDIVALDGWLRLVSPLEALMGFALLTASLTWVIQVYPALTRRRATAIHLDHLCRNQLVDRLPNLASPALAGLLLELSTEISRVRVDLATYSQTYFFWDEGPASLPAALPYALELADTGGRHHRQDISFAAGTLAVSLDDLAVQLRQDSVTAPPDTAATLAAYARANLSARSEA